LARGEFRTIAATTWAEYKRHIEKDPALTRRFDVVKVGEPTVEDTLQILRGAVPNLEKHHEVVVSDDAIDAAVDLTVRYLPERRLPDKALGILDTACARVAIAQDVAPRSLEQAEDLVAYLDAQRLALERDGARVLDVDEKKKALSAEVVSAVKTVKKLRKQWDAEKGIVGELNALFGVVADRSKVPVKTQTVLKLRQDLDALQTDGSMISEMVDRQSIAEIISEWTGVPAGKVVDTEAAQLENLEGAMAARVVGQRAAISGISERIRMSRAGLRDERKPIGVFLLCGPSGVGKTETALALTEKLFGSEQNITTMNMSEFKEEHKVSMLLGAPAGYVGYGEGGVLTEAVRRQPYSVLLLDEFEKAHPGVHDIFYQIFDKGTARDSEGRDVDFRNTVIMMTSNVGDSVVSAFAETHGSDADYKEAVDVVRPELLRFFKPAFLGRLDIVPYFPLSRGELVSIAQLAMARIRRQIKQRYGASFEYTEKCLEDLVDEYRDPNLGGRAVEQALAQRLLPDLARECLSRLAAGKPISHIRVCQAKTGKELELTIQ
jgi:type VI secretion system protein VasG